MTKRKKKFDFKKIKKILPYLLTGFATLALVFVGSLDKHDNNTNLSLDPFASTDYKVSVDQLSELYVVADLSNALSLASASDVATNYVMTTTMYNAGISATNKIEKPSLTGITGSRGVIEHVVAEGETMDSIAAKYGVTTDQIRWSNGLKTTDVSVDMLLYVPSKPGIVYTVKADETIDSIVQKYGGNSEEIIALNDLELSGVTEGVKILIKDGTLPETERPEYVAPVRRTTTYTYTFLGNASSRTNLVCNASLGAGQCTTWGWLKRPDLGFIKANANRWDDVARSAGLVVDHNPAAGAIFQSDAGWYGHVGYVESVNPDGSINVSERNYRGCYGVLFSTIPANEAAWLNYIH